MMSRKNKPKPKPISEKQPETPSIDFEKIFYEALSLVADTFAPAVPRKLPKAVRKTALPKARLRDRILHAETWPERDSLLRGLAAKAYDVANAAREGGDMETALKWMKLVCRFLGLSFTPAKLEDLEQIKRQLEEVKAETRRLKEEKELEEDGED